MSSITPVLGQLLGLGPDELAAIAAAGAALSGVGALATAEVTRRTARRTLRHAEELNYNAARDRVVALLGPAGIAVQDMIRAAGRTEYPEAIVDRARGILSELLGAHFAFNQCAKPGDALAAEFGEAVRKYDECINGFWGYWQNTGRPALESRKDFFAAGETFAGIAKELTYGHHLG